MRSTLFEVFGLQVRSYGFMMVVGFALGIWRALAAARKRGIPAERVYDIALVALVGGIFGARLVFVALNPETESWREFFAVWQGGLSFHGGLAFALVLGYVYTRFVRLGFWQCADLVAPSVAIGYACTRIGCFLNGCCYGRPTDLPWAVRFSENGVLTAPSHPTQIYSALASLAIFFILTRLEKMNRAPGFVFVSYLGLYGVYRFLVELLRKGYSAEVWRWGLTQAQAVSVVMTAASVIAILIVYRRPTEE